MVRRLLILVTALAWPMAAVCGDLRVSLRTPQGKPIANAVVTLAAPHSGPVRLPWAYRMAQQKLQFDPFVLIVPVGADVDFPNRDRVLHHVYSFSPAKTFELKLYGHDETRVVHFDRPGVVPLGCNIHDNMVAFIVVVDTPFVAKTDASGQAVIQGAPAGTWTLRVWHPYLRAISNTLTKPVSVAKDSQAHAELTGDLRLPPERAHSY